LISLIWSDFPEWGFKRWVRALGDVIMVLIIVTDAQPTAALRRLFSRVGFVLLPASVLLIKYYPYLGRGFGEFGDEIVNTGVTTNKNSLGVLVFVVAVGTLWQVIGLLRDKKQPNRTRRLLAQGTLLYFGISLLFTAHSATAGASFTLGAGLMLAIALPFFRARPAAVHALVVAVVLTGILTVLLGAQAEAMKVLGRKPDLTGRTEIWRIVIPMVPNSIVGAGFETFWCGPRVAKFYAMHGGISMTNEAHNGYIEAYLNLGWLGVALIALILVHGYRRAVSAFHCDRALGALLVAYVVTALTYNIGEAGFRMLSVSWFFLLLSIVAASRAMAVTKRARRSHLSLSQAANV
jgi:O-antigen ligase